MICLKCVFLFSIHLLLIFLSDDDNNLISSMEHLTIISRECIEYQISRQQETEYRIKQARSKSNNEMLQYLLCRLISSLRN